MKKKLIALALFTSISMASHADITSVKKVFKANDTALAEQAFSTLTADEKASVDGQILVGRLLIAKDETEDAFDYFEDMLEQHSNNVDVNYYLGVSAVIMAQKASIFSKLGYAKDFIKAMERTVELKPDHQDALNTLIGFHLNAPGIAGGDTEEALTYAKQLQKYDAEQGYSQIANVYWKTEKPELAKQTMAEGFEKFPESGTLYFARAMENIASEAWDKARTDLTFAAQFAKDDEKKGQALYQQGKVSVKSGEEAALGINALTQALPLAEKQYQPWVRYRLAQLYIEEKELAKATDFIAQIDISEDEELEDKVKKLKKKLKKQLKKRVG
ncbi:tetratricopeptide repeat protein [Cognaticolwellia mytili]|uniref:tetratricopeptide repeat protein n=1 Tax=Cognaticolwellia mytili TaxID=1888913 RepID=UPI000A178517|nr:hypothetical protein [Cognaticolwellia mytili]